MAVTKDPRREKINELKKNIPLAQQDLKEQQKLIKRILRKMSDFMNKGEKELAERLSTTVTEQRKKQAAKRAVLEALGEELKLTRLNKRSSSFFSWTPSPMNRRQRKAITRMLHERNTKIQRAN